jgi:hypothetical protein
MIDSPRNNDYYNFPEIDKFSPNGELMIYRISNPQKDDKSTFYVGIVDFGVLSIFNYAAAEVLAEFMRVAAAEYFVEELKLANRVEVLVTRASDHIFIHLSILGIDPVSIEKHAEYLYNYVANNHRLLDESKYELIKSRILLRLEPTFRSVADMGHDNANDLFLSNGQISDLKSKAALVIKNSSNGGALSRVIVEKFVETKRRIVVEFTNAATNDVVPSDSIFNRLKPRLIKFNPTR